MPYLIAYDGKREIHDDDADLVLIAEQTLSDDQFDQLTSKPTDFDEDGQPEAWESITPFDNEWLEALDGRRIENQEAIDLIAAGHATYCGCTLFEQIARAKADPEWLEVKDEFKQLAAARGWPCERDKNNSAYFRTGGERVVRISDHDLGQDWTGRDQTGGAHVNLVFEKGMTATQLMDLVDKDGDA